ncbi:glycosyltransferase [Clostridium chromiireducens]|uniref:Glycosyltransferase n=1 Tax=Clostridium chromiireducens TaxID=225345 RepID=A0A964W2F4_9CLOT|nr:glycosyltransferase [Clostridium chromiireducens]
MNKNILYFTRTMGVGGTEKVILQLCEIMKQESNKIVVCSCGGVNVEELNKMGIKHYGIPDIEKKDIKTVLNTLKIVSKIIKRENINIVHTHHRMAAFYTKIFKITRSFIFIHSAHNTFKDKKLLTKFALGNAYIVAVGNKVKENLCDFYRIPKCNVEVIHNAIKPFKGPIQPIELLQKYRRDGYFLVGNIGRLSEQKGMEYFIKAVPLVLKEYRKIKFFIIGDGEDKEKLENLVSDLNLKNDVILLGYRNDIQNVMSQLELIVLSSLWEGFPLTPIEAFSVGKTIVATAVDGTVEIVEDGVNGILIDPKEEGQIADGIGEIYKFCEKTKTFEESAFEKYKEEFSYEVLKNRYRIYYKKLMG